jgi:hypothetical protein
VIAIVAGGLVAVAIAAHVGSEDGEPGVGQRRGDIPPGVGGREEAVPEDDRLTSRIASAPIVQAHAVEADRLASAAGDVRPGGH